MLHDRRIYLSSPGILSSSRTLKKAFAKTDRLFLSANKEDSPMKKFALILAAAMAAALLLTGCFSEPQPAPTAMPSSDPTATVVPAATDAPTDAPSVNPSAAPEASDSLADNLTEGLTDGNGLNVAPSPSASTNP